MKNPGKTLKFGLIMGIALSFVSPAFAQGVGKVTYVEGRVDVVSSDNGEALPLKEGQIINLKEFIRTKSDGKTEITFLDNSVLRLAKNSRVQIDEYRLDNKNERKTACIKLERGEARFIISKSSQPAPFIICTPNTKGEVKGSEIFVSYQAGSSSLLVAEGTLAIANLAHPENILTVPAGNSILITQEELPKAPRPFMDIEKKLLETDTQIPVSFSKVKEAGEIRGLIAEFSGEVKVTPKGKTEAHRPKTGEVVLAGDKIQTGKDGIAVIVFDNGNAISLKPETEIEIIKLISDPKTGEYENLFQSRMGKIKARIENLKGKSKFEVRTPTAVCGARGTIMYLNITPLQTTSFFEGGRGFMTQPGTGETSFVESGETITADAEGNLSDPQNVSEGERMGFDEGWEPQGGEGGSSEGGTGGLGLFDFEAGEDASGSDSGSNSAGLEADFSGLGDVDVGDFFVDIPVTEVEEENPEPPVNKVGDFYYSYLGAGGPVLTIDGSLYDVGVASNFPSVWLGSPVPMTVTGKYTLNGASTYHIWTAGDIYSYNPLTGTYTTADGGAYYGLIGGTRGEMNATPWMEGLFAALYIDPSNNAGILRGAFDGTDAANFSLAGLVSAVQKEAAIEILPQDLHANVYQEGEFYGSGRKDFGGNNDVTLKMVDGIGMEIDTGSGTRGWGIWGTRIAGSYHGDLTPLLPWEVQIAGTEENENGTKEGALLLSLKTNDWSLNRINGTVDGITLDIHDQGKLSGSTVTGDMRGCYIDVPLGDEGSWQAVSCGDWVEVNNNLDWSSLAALTADIQAINVSVPISEVVTSTGLAGAGTFGTGTSINVSSMDVGFYALTPVALDGVWAALINGTYNYPSPTSNDWSVTVNNGAADSATITGTEWSNNQWRADVTGSTGSGISYNGAASGTYDGADAFSGSGTGTWSSPNPQGP